MPCRTDYMEPRARERESHEVAGMLVQLHNIALPDVRIPSHISDAAASIYGMESKVDEFTAMLCSYASEPHVQQKVQDEANQGNIPAMEIMLWWRKHEEVDRKRKEKEAANLARQRSEDIAKLRLLMSQYPEEAQAIANYRAEAMGRNYEDS